MRSSPQLCRALVTLLLVCGCSSTDTDTEPVKPPPTFRRPLTAPGMTERGLTLFNQGRFQEAIDQFTKAMALDPSYKPAWAHRAEAYDRLGRQKEAAEDMRRLEAI